MIADRARFLSRFVVVGYAAICFVLVGASLAFALCVGPAIVRARRRNVTPVARALGWRACRRDVAGERAELEAEMERLLP